MTKNTIITYTMWIIQGLLALLFLFAGGMKLVLPLAELTKQMPLPLAALGLANIMAGATAVTLASGAVAPALIALTVGILAAFVAYRRANSFSSQRSALCN